MKTGTTGLIGTIRKRPLLLPLLFCAVFLGFSLVYIHASSAMAARAARSLEHLQQIEALKGTLYVFAAALLFFAVMASLCLMIARQVRHIEAQQEALIQSDRRAMAGCFAASVAHDLNNILTMMSLQMQELSLREDRDSPLGRIAAEMNSAIRRLADLSRRLMDVGREGAPGKFKDEELGRVLQGCIQLAQPYCRKHNCEISLHQEQPVRAEINRASLEHMAINLLINAADACPNTGTIRLNLIGVNGNALIEVHDSGPGIAQDQIAQIFKPFYTTKSKGCGLGLLSVKACVELHRGNFEVGRSDLGGACFRVRLPVHHAPDAETRQENGAADWSKSA